MTQFCAPANPSLLNPNEFRFYLHRAPYLTFFAQTVSLPTINMEASSSTDNPFTTIKVPGDHVDFEQLSVDFLVDEDLQGYLEMYRWIRGLGFPDSFDEYVALVQDPQYNGSVWLATTSDISVFTFSGARDANIEWVFHDAFPVMVSAPTVSSANPDQPIVTAKVRFEYTTFDVQSVKSS